MIEVIAFRSDGMIETIYEQKGWTNDYDPGWDMTADVVIGQFEGAQLTYSDLRAWSGDEVQGDVVAALNGQGDWIVHWPSVDDRQRSYPFSDVVLRKVS